jgi:hypothetical protein
MTTLYPEYKEAAKVIAKGETVFYSDKELSGMLDAEMASKDFEFRKLNLICHLLQEYHIDFIRSENETDGKGYKVATSAESLNVTTGRLSRRIRNAAMKQRAVLGIINRAELSADDSELYDRHAIKNGLLVSFLNKSPLRLMRPGVRVRVDVPKMITD